MRPQVLIFTMEGCPGCTAVKPPARMMQWHYKPCVDTRFVDVHEEGALADAMLVEQTPTVIALDAEGRPIARMIGYSDPNRLQRIFDAAAERATSCAVRPFRDV